MGFVTALIDEIRSARAQVHVPVGLKADLVATSLTDAARAAWARNEALIKRLARDRQLHRRRRPPRAPSPWRSEGATFAIPLQGLIDIAEEKARLQKAHGQAGQGNRRAERPPQQPQLRQIRPRRRGDGGAANLEAREDEAAKITRAP